MSDQGGEIPAEWDSQRLRVVPLWEDASDVTAIRLSENTEEFIEMSIEEPNSVRLIAYSLKGFLVYFFYFLVGTHGGPESQRFQEIQSLAVDLEFIDLQLVLDTRMRKFPKPMLESFRAFTQTL